MAASEDTMPTIGADIILKATLTRWGEDQGERMDYPVGLTTTPLPGGGLRWWFLCPLVVSGVPWGRRVGKLYMPPGGRYFGWRHSCVRDQPAGARAGKRGRQ